MVPIAYVLTVLQLKKCEPEKYQWVVVNVNHDHQVPVTDR